MERPSNGPIHSYTLRKLALPGPNREGLSYVLETNIKMDNQTKGSEQQHLKKNIKVLINSLVEMTTDPKKLKNQQNPKNVHYHIN